MVSLLNVWLFPGALSHIQRRATYEGHVKIDSGLYLRNWASLLFVDFCVSSESTGRLRETDPCHPAQRSSGSNGSSIDH